MIDNGIAVLEIDIVVFQRMEFDFESIRIGFMIYSHLLCSLGWVGDNKGVPIIFKDIQQQP